ncbi:MAG: hypothetical protein JXN60_06140 [Lentisphaerae bacterium]|nr:hypothetical protein [Lentisphaerota bacterium]
MVSKDFYNKPEITLSVHNLVDIQSDFKKRNWQKLYFYDDKEKYSFYEIDDYEKMEGMYSRQRKGGLDFPPFLKNVKKQSVHNLVDTQEDDKVLCARCVDNTGLETYFDKDVLYCYEEILPTDEPMDGRFLKVQDKFGDWRVVFRSRFETCQR